MTRSEFCRTPRNNRKMRYFLKIWTKACLRTEKKKVPSYQKNGKENLCVGRIARKMARKITKSICNLRNCALENLMKRIVNWGGHITSLQRNQRSKKEPMGETKKKKEISFLWRKNKTTKKHGRNKVLAPF